MFQPGALLRRFQPGFVTRAELMSVNERRPGTCCRCWRPKTLHVSYSDMMPPSMDGSIGWCCECQGCKRVTLTAYIPMATVSFKIRLHKGIIVVSRSRRRFAGSLGRLMGYRCAPGMHRGVRQRDGSLVCRVCGERRSAA